MRTIWIFSLSLFLVYGCCESKKGTEEIMTGLDIRKNIIYVEDEHCEEVALFYHDMLGISYLKNGEDYKWVEFETGACKLCIHHNNKRVKPFEGGVINIVFYVGTQDKVLELHKKLLVKGFNEISIVGGGKDKHLAPGQMSELFTWKTSKGESITSFWCSDPVGNIVQIEPRHKE